MPPARGKIFVSVYNIQDETGQFKPYPASNFSTAVPQSATVMLVSANILIEGSIIGYESNVKSGGVGARYFGIGASTQYQLDQIAVNLRAVDVNTGEVLSSVIRLHHQRTCDALSDVGD